MLLIRFLSALPSSLLYGIGSFFAFIGYRVVGYRKGIIISNLKYAFPEKDDREINALVKEFYSHIFQVFTELIVSFRLKKEDWLSRVQVENAEEVKKCLDQGIPIIFMNGHTANWEWTGPGGVVNIPYPYEFIYKKINNKVLEKVMMTIRTKHGGTAVEKEEVMTELIKRVKEPRWIAFVADQSPTIFTDKKWVKFLDRDTAFYIGTEKIATQLNYAVFYVDTSRIKRGNYQIRLRLVSMPPYKKDVDYKIIEKYAEFLGDTIRKNPAHYLWSHRRWKYSREEAEVATSKRKSRVS